MKSLRRMLLTGNEPRPRPSPGLRNSTFLSVFEAHDFAAAAAGDVTRATTTPSGQPALTLDVNKHLLCRSASKGQTP